MNDDNTKLILFNTPTTLTFEQVPWQSELVGGEVKGYTFFPFCLPSLSGLEETGSKYPPLGCSDFQQVSL
jgi:hypothetical protein